MLCLIFSLIKSIKNIIFIVFAIEQEPPANKKDIYQEKWVNEDNMNCPSLIEAYYKNKKRHLD